MKTVYKNSITYEIYSEIRAVDSVHKTSDSDTSIFKASTVTPEFLNF